MVRSFLVKVHHYPWQIVPDILGGTALGSRRRTLRWQQSVIHRENCIVLDEYTLQMRSLAILLGACGEN